MNCVHVQLYRDSKDRYNNGQTKASLSLQYFLAVQSGFTLDKESNTIAIICEDVTVIFAFDTREQLIQWQAKIAINLGEDEQFLVQISSAPPRSKLTPGPARLHVLERRFCLTAGVPPRLLGHWQIAQLRKYGVVNGRFCFEGGSQCGRGEGLHVLLTDRGNDVSRSFSNAAQGNTPLARRAYLHVGERSISSSRTEANLCEQLTDCRSRSQENLCWTPPGDCGGWESSGLCHREGTVSRPRCRSCHVRISRSSTVTCAPGTGFTWTMESCGIGQSIAKSPSCQDSRQTSTLATIWDPSSPGRPPPRPPKTKPPTAPEDLPASLKRPRPSPSMPVIGLGRCDCDSTNLVEEYYDTPRSFKSTILEEPERSNTNSHCVDKTVCNCQANANTGISQSFSVNQVKGIEQTHLYYL
ncbi:protein Dok-7-like [Macrosteles quadrilineatus]|uniref:protein Dok-7-like n=1 Tax=Macrosteles quadrilineatus TaxID=74068 RepID=UPI0023E1BDED|nr:protein Dok-7-like [Macrosteles quadrilineatus]